jgi:hypothetical protein
MTESADIVVDCRHLSGDALLLFKISVVGDWTSYSGALERRGDSGEFQRSDFDSQIWSLGPGVRYKMYPMTPTTLTAATITMASIAAPPQWQLFPALIGHGRAWQVDTVFT